MPEIGIPANEMNTKIRISAPEGWNTYKTNDDISLDIKIISEEEIAFPSNYGARLFTRRNHEWIEIANLTHYPEGIFLLVPYDNKPFNIGATSVFPILSDPSEPITIRIILVGNVFKDGQVTDEVTAGYVDVDLKP